MRQLRLDRKSTIEELQDKLHFVPWLICGRWLEECVGGLNFQICDDAEALTELDETKGNSAEMEQLKAPPVLPFAAKHGNLRVLTHLDAELDIL